MLLYANHGLLGLLDTCSLILRCIFIIENQGFTLSIPLIKIWQSLVRLINTLCKKIRGLYNKRIEMS